MRLVTPQVPKVIEWGRKDEMGNGCCISKVSSCIIYMLSVWPSNSRCCQAYFSRGLLLTCEQVYTTTAFVCSFAKILLVALLIHVKTFDICSSDPFWNCWDCSAAVADNTITARFYMACRPQASPDEHGGRMQWVIPQPFRLWATRLLCTTWTWLIAASRLLVVNFAFNLRIGTPRRELCSFKMMQWIRYGHDQSFILLYNMIVRLFRRQWHKHSFLMGLLGTAVHLGRARKRRMYQLHDWPSIFFSIAPPSSHY